MNIKGTKIRLPWVVSGVFSVCLGILLIVVGFDSIVPSEECVVGGLLSVILGVVTIKFSPDPFANNVNHTTFDYTPNYNPNTIEITQESYSNFDKPNNNKSNKTEYIHVKSHVRRKNNN